MATLTHLVTPDLPLSCRSKFELENAGLPRITIIRDMCWDRSSSSWRNSWPNPSLIQLQLEFSSHVLSFIEISRI